VRAPAPRLVAAVAVGGAAGALLRHLLGELVPDGEGFPWTTFGINVSGAFVLALLPAARPVRRSDVLAAALGPGVLGGFTTMSTYAEQVRTLLADGEAMVAGAYLLGTLAACVAAVVLAATWTRRRERDELAAAGGDA